MKTNPILGIHQKTPGVNSSFETSMMCMDDYELEPLIYEKLISKENCICTNSRLENLLMYLY